MPATPKQPLNPVLNPIQDRFSAAAPSYNHHARIQRQSAHLLFQWLQTHSDNRNPGCCIDVGCGTGFVTEQLIQRFSNTPIYAVDIAPGMLQTLKNQHNHPLLYTRLANGESLHPSDYTPTPQRLLISNLCVQWFKKPIQTIKNWANHYQTIALSVLLEGSFQTWKQAHHDTQQACGLYPLPTEQQLNLLFEELIQQNPSWHFAHHTQTLEDWHPDGLSFARSLRAIGADAPIEQHRPANLHAVIRAIGQPCTMNYKIGFYLLEQP